MTDLSKCDVYIASKPCGCIVAAVVNNPEHAKDVAKSVARWIREGFGISKVSDIKDAKWAKCGGKCEHDASDHVGRC